MTPRRRPPADGDLAFVPEWAERTERFFERVLRHTKGRYARAPFILSPWQRDDIIYPLFGTARYDAQFGEWVRAYSEAWLELGRKNGKSELMAGTALKLLVADDEEAAEIYGAAKDREQAGLIYFVAARMVRLSPALRNRLRVIDSRKTIVDPKTDSVYKVIAADADGNLGQDPSGILFDEIISQPNRDLYDTFRSSFGSGSRRQPLLIAATTAGNDPSSFAKTEHDAAAAIAEDPTKAPHRFVYIRNTAPDADPWLEENWHHANPALGDFLSLNRLRVEALEAREDPTKENAFRQYRLNQWVQQTTRAIRLEDWDKNAGLVDRATLIGRPTFAGLDLAATSDLAGYALLFPPTEVPDNDADLELPILFRYWCPEAVVDDLDKYTGGKFSVWIRQGFITATPGDVIDYDIIHRDITQDAKDFDLRLLSLDVWNSSSTMTWAENHRITADAVSQTFRALSPPTKELLRLIKLKALRHGGNPVTRWNVDAVEVKRDHNDNIRPIKPDRAKSGKRIDGFVALILAVDGWSRRGQSGRSVYEDQGLDVV